MARIYLSCDELERRAARRWATADIYQHPREVAALKRGDWLVIDFDHILFDDRSAAVALMHAAARRGVRVGVHTYSEGDPRLARMLALPGVVVAKRQKDVLIAFDRDSRAQRRAA